VSSGLQANIYSGQRRLTLKGDPPHLDNAPVHNSKKPRAAIDASLVHIVPLPSFGPDLAPIEFFLFDIIKVKMKCISAVQRMDSLSKITRIINGIPEV
jgi:hypothetical protein